MRKFLSVNNHIAMIVNFTMASDVFPKVVIKGGVSYFLYSSRYLGNVHFVNYLDSVKKEQNRPLFEDGLDVVLGDGAEYDAIQKVSTSPIKFNTLEEP